MHCGHYLTPNERAITLVSLHQQQLVDDVPFHLKFALNVTHRLRKTPTSSDFRLKRLNRTITVLQHASRGFSATAELFVPSIMSVYSFVQNVCIGSRPDFQRTRQNRTRQGINTTDKPISLQLYLECCCISNSS